MIDFKNKDELPTNVVICGSLAVIVIAGACKLFLPPPALPTLKEDSAARGKIVKSTLAMKKALTTVQADLGKETWPGNPEDVGPIALKQINTLIGAHHLKLVGFHSQKPIEQPNMTLVPFIVSVDGTFPSVMALTKDIEQADTKLVVNLFQVSNADQSSDKVTASIGITAYQLPQPPAAMSTSSSPSTPAKITPSKGAPTKTSKGAKTNA
jgi:hypothetical protein